MEQRVLGQTGLQVAVLGYGAGNIGGLLVRGDPQEQRATLSAALEGGITYFDTAPQYGAGRSEERLGRELRALGALERVIVGTKVRLTPTDMADPRQAIRQSVEASLRRLGRNWVDLIQLHNRVARHPAGTGDALQVTEVNGAVAEGLREVVASGLARHAGFTALGETAAIEDVIAAGAYATAQTYINALDPSALEPGASGASHDFNGVARTAAGAGMGVIAIRVLAAGALGATAPRHPTAGDPGSAIVPGADYAADVERARALVPVVRDFGLESTLELALRFVLSWREVSIALVGISDRQQLEAALRWANRGPLPPDAIQRILDLARGATSSPHPPPARPSLQRGERDGCPT